MVSVGDPIYAADHAQTNTAYTPVLGASTTAPTLGTGSSAVGQYRRDPISGMVDASIRLTFGTSGTAAGSGTYLVDLPTAVDGTALASTATLATGASPVLGIGTLRDQSVPAGAVVVAALASLTGGTGSVGQVFLEQASSSSAASVSSASPWAWAASDQIVLTLRYPSPIT